MQVADNALPPRYAVGGSDCHLPTCEDHQQERKLVDVEHCIQLAHSATLVLYQKELFHDLHTLDGLKEP